MALALPILVLGEPAYPPAEWRRVVIWTVVAPVVAATTHELVRSERSAHAAAAVLARTDALTGLLNRHGLKELAERERHHARRSGTPLAVAVLDLDHFKNVNDAHGHDTGDQLLREAATAWQQALRETDLLARWGGEEFVIVLPLAAQRSAIAALERVRQATPRQQTCSLGVTLWNPEEQLQTVVARADTGLYEAKASGRNRLVVVPPPLPDLIGDKARTTEPLRGEADPLNSAPSKMRSS